MVIPLHTHILIMGCLFSSSLHSSQPFNGVRIIHINGYIEEFSCPVTALQITGKPTKHVLCTAAQLLSVGSQPIRPNDPLESGQVYFLLPHSVFGSDSSPTDLVSLATRLNAVANRAGSNNPVKTGLVLDGETGFGADLSGGRMAWSQPHRWQPVLDTIWEMSLRSKSSVGSIASIRSLSPLSQIMD